jgi:cobalamin biosynthesis protein CobT
LWIRYYRDFAEAWEKGAVRLAGADRNVRNNTLDAESIKHGIRRLLERPEKRKILFVFNDGMPFPGYGNLSRCQRHLLDVVAAAATQGVEIVAFGIQSDDVKEYYPNHLIIQDLADLAKEPLKMLDNMLRKGVIKR